MHYSERRRSGGVDAENWEGCLQCVMVNLADGLRLERHDHFRSLRDGPFADYISSLEFCESWGKAADEQVFNSVHIERSSPTVSDSQVLS